jgi:mono/diheme cytochrome c family protein
MKTRLKYITSIGAVMVIALTGCVNNPDSPGLEYMPDMYRSPAIEAYVDYGQDPYQVGEEKAEGQRRVQSARKPVAGSIAFAPAEMDFAMPYAYANTVDGYEEAGLKLRSPLTSVGQNELELGKEVYTLMCTQCHGELGKGDGALSRNGHIVGIPSYSDKLKDLPEGKMYHTLTYGKGLMGSHASQLSQKDRWLVIEYIKVLQNGGDMPEFDEDGNVKQASSENEDAMAMNS